MLDGVDQQGSVTTATERFERAVEQVFGGLHSVLLFLGAGLIAAGFALRQENAGRRLPIASFGAGALQVLGAYPWLTPAWVNMTTAAALFHL